MDLTGEELRRKIAELEGWTDIQVGNERSLLDDANRELRGIPPVGPGPWDIRIIHYKIPDWLTDANAAMELVGKITAHDAVAYVDITAQHGGCFTAGIGFAADSEDIDVHGDSFCEAVCRLYVAWRESKR